MARGGEEARMAMLLGGYVGYRITKGAKRRERRETKWVNAGPMSLMVQLWHFWDEVLEEAISD